MNIPPKILGAAALVPVLGFACGALAATAIDTTPIVGGKEDYLADIPVQHQQTVSVEQAKAMKAKANHYPLETPYGTIEVAELAYHGRMRNRAPERALYEARYGEGFAYEQAAEQSAPPVPEPIPQMVWPVDPDAVTAIVPHEGPPLSGEEDMAIAEEPAPARGGPRVINVQAALAARH